MVRSGMQCGLDFRRGVGRSLADSAEFDNGPSSGDEESEYLSWIGVVADNNYGL